MDEQPGNHVADNRHEHARGHVQRGELERAEQAYAELLAEQPNDVESLQFLASRQMSADRFEPAVTLLVRASATAPDRADLWNQLAIAQSGAGDEATAITSWRRCLQLAPDMFVARLRLAWALEQRGQSHAALMHYFHAITTAQNHGRWLSDATTAPALRVAVKHAMEVVNVGRRQLFYAALEPLRQRYGRSELTRVEHCLAVYLHDQPTQLADTRQQPKFLYFPGLPSQPYYARERFEWQRALEEVTGAIREELREVIQHPEDLAPFLQSGLAEETAAYLGSSGSRAGAWDAYFFYRHGERFDAHCERCPRTAAALDQAPLVRIRDHAPETLFSVLRPGTHILPHRGVTNTRLVTHLPLIVPADCALRVGGELHAWQEGRCVTFDDTFEHEAWNRSEETRVVLILDSWNPDLSEIERAAVTDLVEAIGDFNQASRSPPLA